MSFLYIVTKFWFRKQIISLDVRSVLKYWTITKKALFHDTQKELINLLWSIYCWFRNSSNWIWSNIIPLYNLLHTYYRIGCGAALEAVIPTNRTPTITKKKPEVPLAMTAGLIILQQQKRMFNQTKPRGFACNLSLNMAGSFVKWNKKIATKA